MLKEEKKFIDSDLFEGMTSISALIKGIESNKNNRRILRILFDESKIKSKKAELGFLRAKSIQMGFKIDFVSPSDIQKFSIGNSHGGVLAECSVRELPPLSFDYIRDDGVYFILEGVEDPYNFGYAIRSLYAAGVDGVILSQRNWMGAAGIVARSSAGTSELIDMFICEPINAIPIFKEKNYAVVCAGIRDSDSLFDTSLKKPLLVVLGGEKRGISRNILNLADQIIRIDYGNTFGGSLSTSAAAAVFAFEILRYNRLT